MTKRNNGDAEKRQKSVSELLNTYRNNGKGGWIIPVLFLEW